MLPRIGMPWELRPSKPAGIRPLSRISCKGKHSATNLYMGTNPRKTREMGGSSQALHARAPTDQRRYGLLFSRLDVQRTARSPSTDHGSQTNAKYQPGRRPMPTGGSVKGADQHGAKGGKQVTNGLGHTG